MRVKPAPGTYIVTIEGGSHPLIVTEQGAMTMFQFWGWQLELDWEWFEIAGGPVLSPGGGKAVQFIGFNGDGTVDVVFKDGSGKSGAYEPA